MKLLRALLELVAPRVCMVCEADPAAWDVHLCPECLSELWRPGTRFQRCDDIPFVTWVAFLGPYSGAIRSAVHAAKFGRHPEFARHLGDLLAWRLPPWAAPPELLLPVPANPATLRRRGFNQALEIAIGLSRHLQVPVADGLLSKARPTTSQKELPLLRRQQNVSGCFALNNAPALRGRRVGLVDDVTTTGATLAAAARLLREAGAAEVTAYVIGRTLRKGSREQGN